MKKHSLKIGTLAIALMMALAACSPPADTVSTGGDAASTGSDNVSTATGAENPKEAPMLAALVEAGELEPVEDRMPVASDIMVEDMESIGAYGDYLTFTFTGKNQQWKYGKATEEPLFRFLDDGTVEPNVAKGFDVNEDSTVWTIYLREGMRWSDGEPFTANDVLFYFYNMCIPQTFGKSVYDCYYSTNPETLERTLCEMELIDDYTYTVTFADPKPSFLEDHAINAKQGFAPAHWYMEILPEFIGEEAAEAKATELGYSDVAAMGQETGYYYWNVIGRPTLRPWVTTNDPDSDLFIMARNPYYWKTDSAGSQLPYVDELQWVRVSEDSQTALKVMSGEVDIAMGLSWDDIVALKDAESVGNYSLITWDSVNWGAATGSIQFNLTVEDPNLRELFNNIYFRQAMSIAVDREEMAILVMDGWVDPTQSAPAEGMQGASDEWTYKWTEYDVAEAKRLLEEECGLVMGADGFYQFADGSPLTIDIVTAFDTAAVSRTAELLTEKYYPEIGIKANFNLRDRSLVDDMVLGNEIVAILSPVAPMGTVSIALRPDTVVPVRNYAVWYGQYGTWYASGGTDGVEPEGAILELIELYRELLTATTADEVERLSEAMLKLHSENIWQISYYSDPPTLIALNNELRNFPDERIYCDEFRETGHAHLQCVYFESDKL